MHAGRQVHHGEQKSGAAPTFGRAGFGRCDEFSFTAKMFPNTNQLTSFERAGRKVGMRIVIEVECPSAVTFALFEFSGRSDFGRCDEKLSTVRREGRF